MAKVKKAERSYELEKTGNDEVIMHFKMGITPMKAGWASIGSLFLWFGVLGGWLPALFIAAVFHVGINGDTNSSESPLFNTVFWGSWIGMTILPWLFCSKKKTQLHERGSVASSLKFTADNVRTAKGELLDREDISSVYWCRPDTSYTYKGSFEQKVKEAEAQNKLAKANYLCVDYGTDRTPITYEALTEKQAQDMTNAFHRWLQDPASFFEEANDPGRQAAA